MIKVSVIVPVYKVELFVERCIRSLMEQTLQEVEFIIIDDCSPDNSLAIIKNVINDYPTRIVRIISHPINQGLPAARNTGLKIATGEYIFHCDSDDWVEPDMFSELYTKAKSCDVDIVWCDWFLTYRKSERYMKQPCYNSPIEAIKGMLNGTMKYNVWNKLVRRNLYVLNDITFPTGYGMGEDMTMIRLFSCAQKVLYVPKGFYHYVKLNSEAFSQTYSEKHLLELRHNVQETLSYLFKKYRNSLAVEYEFFKLDVKYPFLISDDKNKYAIWQSWYPESNKYIWLNNKVSIRRRILQLLASKGQYWLIFLYYKLVYKFIYGIIYR